MPKRLPWTERELARMKDLYEKGALVAVIATRFGCNRSTVLDLARKYGWQRSPT